MKRLALVLFVGLMMANTAGIFEMLLPERCDLLEVATTDEDCSSTCTRCHCGRAFELTFASAPVDDFVATTPFVPLSLSTSLPHPDDILHVPRPSAS